MNNLSLTTAEFERLLKVFAGFLAVMWATFFYVQWHFLNTAAISAAWRAFSPAVGIASLAFGIFYKVAWRHPTIAKWMSRPIVHGVWYGQLRSSFGAVDGKQLVLPIVFVVRQTYLSLSVQSFTASQEGESRLEALLRNSKTEATRLCYVFELRKAYAGAHALTSGAGELKLIANDKELKGTYWTNTPTHGELGLRLLSRDCAGIDCFQDAVSRWPRIKASP